jgi:hypothetical protein
MVEDSFGDEAEKIFSDIQKGNRKAPEPKAKEKANPAPEIAAEPVYDSAQK